MAHKENTPIFELLAPAGSPAILEAVIKAGADAVYLGGDRYGARAYAENFTQEQLLWALDYAHIRGRKIYLTVNTLLKNTEIDGLCNYIAPLYERGLDAVLVQDFGALYILRESFPDLPIHASTQMTLTGADGVRFLQEQGVQRVVLSRELSLEEAARIHEETGMELEVFVHGALCYCYSGQCLFSSVLGGRSGNRGRCAQPCRLPYTVSDERNESQLRNSYILSMKDLCGINDLPALHQAGVYSLKIEGRMKQEVYASGVVSYYRKYIDRYISQITEGNIYEDKISKIKPQTDHSSLKMANFSIQNRATWEFPVPRADKQALSDLGNRCGLTDGYYWKRNGSDMITYSKPNFTTNTSTETHESSVTVGNEKVRIFGHAVFRKERPSELSVWTDGNNIRDFKTDNPRRINDFAENDSVFATVTGQVPDKALKTPVTTEDLRERLMKTGDTPFVFAELTIDAEKDIFVQNGAVNRLRRDALIELENAILDSFKRKPAEIKTPDFLKESASPQEPQRLIALVSNPDQLAAVLADGRMTDIYLETVTCTRAEFLKNLFHCFHMIEDAGQEYAVYLALPPVFRQHTREFYTSIAPSIARQLPVRQTPLSEPQEAMRANNENTGSKPKANVVIRGFLIRNYEEFAWVGEHFPAAERIIDHHLYTYNDASAVAFFEAGARRNTIPLELNRSEIFGRDNRYSEIVVYGRYPLMISAQCVHANSTNTFNLANTSNSVSAFNSGESGCDRRSVITTLTDRKGVQFPVCNFCSECMNVIYNSVPTMLFGRINELKHKGILSFRLEFTIENGKEVSDILRNLSWPAMGSESAKDNTIANRKRNERMAHTDKFTTYTNGHYTRGVE